MNSPRIFDSILGWLLKQWTEDLLSTIASSFIAVCEPLPSASHAIALMSGMRYSMRLRITSLILLLMRVSLMRIAVLRPRYQLYLRLLRPHIGTFTGAFLLLMLLISAIVVENVDVAYRVEVLDDLRLLFLLPLLRICLILLCRRVRRIHWYALT
jgi:hypothetical protein